MRAVLRRTGTILALFFAQHDVLMPDCVSLARKVLHALFLAIVPSQRTVRDAIKDAAFNRLLADLVIYHTFC